MMESDYLKVAHAGERCRSVDSTHLLTFLPTLHLSVRHGQEDSSMKAPHVTHHGADEEFQQSNTACMHMAACVQTLSGACGHALDQ